MSSDNAASNGADRIPEKPALEGLEAKWAPRWESQGTYQFDRDAALAAGSAELFSVDTPPPTASGSLHIGHVFSYTHMDLVTRFQRMRGKHIFYPMGWDDNGLPTERRVQNYYGVRCEPMLAYQPGFVPPLHGGIALDGTGASSKAADQLPISRRNFIELCETLTAEDEKQFEDLWRQLGLSVDWNLTYRTIGQEAQLAAQRAFVRNLARGEAYQAEAPTLWDITFRTAVAQAELEDKEQPAAYHRLAFHRAGGDDIHIETTRPELLAACVALVAHPDDERYQALFGTTVTTPIFGVEVPIVSHHLAQKDKGSGIAMICTFGDVTDVVWWRELDLPNRTIIGADGRIVADPPEAIATDAAIAAYAELAGKTVFSAKAKIVELLTASGEMIGDARPIIHSVKFFEKGDKPLEIISTRQWYIKNGARDAALRARLVEAGKQIGFTPEHMRVRYDNWVGGLTGDWLISRQRFFGVPIPVWYHLHADGTKGDPIVPSEDVLPIDPSSDVPAGFTEADRGVAFVGELDIMDTWATSSLTPQIAGGWVTDPELFTLVFPYSLRSQGQDIIRTWLFSTVLRAELEEGVVPWKNAGISGFIVDPDRKKMSKSKGNVVTPKGMLDDHGSDAVRYWAASSRLGTDAAFDPQNPKQIKIGRRLAIKVLNAAKFVYSFPPASNTRASTLVEPLDIDMLAELNSVIETATTALEDFDHAKALEVTEKFLWTFCDDYMELVKERAYGASTPEGQASAATALRTAIEVLVRLLAPYLPFATEEVWSWTHDESVHGSAWPTTSDTAVTVAPSGLLGSVSAALIGIRRAKTDAKASQKADVVSATIAGPAILSLGLGDLSAVGRIARVEFVESESIEVRDIVLAEVTE